MSPTICRQLLVLCMASAASTAFAQWVPTGALAKVPVVKDCDQTAGDVMATRLDPPTIYVCPLVVNEVRRKQPGLEHFFLVHEYGHIAVASASESLADCWAARALAGTPHGQRYLDAAIAFLGRRGNAPSATYGSPAERAERIRECANPHPDPLPQAGEGAPAP